MTGASDPFPGGEDCPLESWRRRFCARATIAALAAAFALIFGIIIWSLR